MGRGTAFSASSSCQNWPSLGVDRASSFPQEDGGASMSAVEYCICIEELARVDPSIALSVSPRTTDSEFGAHPTCSGREAQRRSATAHPPRDVVRGSGAWGAHRTESAGSDAVGDPDDGGASTVIRLGARTVRRRSRRTGASPALDGRAMAVTDPAKGHRTVFQPSSSSGGHPGLTAGKQGKQVRDAGERYRRGGHFDGLSRWRPIN